MRLSALAAAVMLATALTANHAQALSLGRLSVQSALGEPLLAEIDIPDITEAETAALRVGLAPADVYRAAGADFNALLASTDIRLERRADGRVFLRISNSRPITEPYLDLILEANWGSGRIVRDYTMLFDPPKPRTPVAATLPPSIPAAVSVSRPVAATPLPAITPAARPTPAPAPAAARPPAPPAPPPAAPASPSQNGNQVIVKAGDTASRIANANKPANASLEQMLVAMLRTNPQAFIQNNIHKIKSGAVLDFPAPADVTAITTTEARQIVATQGHDFNSFRQRLATAALPAADAAPGRKASGTVQAEVKDTKATTQTPDQLKLTKGSVHTPNNTAAEDNIAQARQAKDSATKAAELSRNIAELTKLNTVAASTGPAPAPSPTPAATTPPAAAPAIAVAANTPPAAPAPAATPPAPAPATPATAATPTEVPKDPAKPEQTPEKPQDKPATPPPAPAPAPTPAVVPAPAAAEEPSLLDALLDNPLLLPIAGGLIALLAGVGVYRLRQRKKPATVDSSFLESRLQPDSFFGASGGQSIDTAEVVPTGNSMMYSPSQLDAGGDVDPVAEADVYLAYGRDLQAEEILVEALKVNPSRPAVHVKMMEIFAKRRNVKAFEMQALELYALTHGNGPEWAQACTLGSDLSPNNPLFKPGGGPPDTVAAVADTQPPSSFNESPDTQPAADGGDLDLDLDFSLDVPSPVPAPAPTPASAPAPTPTFSTPAAMAAPASSMPDIDFGLAFDIPDSPAPPASQAAAPSPSRATPASAAAPAPANPPDDLGLTFDFADFSPPAPSPQAAPAAPPSTDNHLDFSNDFDLHFDLPAPAPAPLAAPPATAPAMAPATAPAPAQAHNMLGFDMGDLSLDLTPGATSDQLAAFDSIPEGDPLETKLSLAAEFLAIGDEDGARSLAEEVLEQATGALKTKAKNFLADLS